MGIVVKHTLEHPSGRIVYRRAIPPELRPFAAKREHKAALGRRGEAGLLARWEDLMRWRDHLLVEPTKAGKLRSPVTVKSKYLTAVKATLGWAVQERKLAANVALGVVVRIPKKAKLRERDFTNDEATAILKATLKPDNSRQAAGYVLARRWIPWLCAYTGARVNEFSQLRGADVRCIDDIWTVRITPEAGTVKAKVARVIPLPRTWSNKASRKP